MRLVSLVVPAFNESARIQNSLRQIDAAFFARQDFATEIIVVDDGSADDTLEQLRMLAPELKCDCLIITHDVNQGLGGALRTGFAQTRGDIVVAVDADLSYSIEDIFTIIERQIETGVHVVIASPYMPGGQSLSVPPALERRSRTANKILGRAAIHELHTVTGMVRAYDGKHIRGLSLKAVDIDINSEIIYKTELLRGSILEVPATLNWTQMADRATRSRLGSKRSRWNTAKSLVNAFLFRPFMFPLIPAPVTAVLAVVFLFCPGGMAGLTLAVGMAIFTGMLLIFSVLMLQLKRYFEETYSAVLRATDRRDYPSHAQVVFDHRQASEPR